MKKYTLISLPNTLICLLGVKHCGKTSLARYLAEHIAIHAIDIDNEIVAAYPLPPQAESQTNKQNIRTIYKIVGKEAFQELEYSAINTILTKLQNHPNGICVATGGGICDNSLAIELLRPVSVFVNIQISYEKIWERLQKKGIPAYLENEENPRETFRLICERRSAIYTSIADISINGDAETSEKAAELLEELEKLPNSILTDR